MSQAANVVWLIIFGWAAALGHLFAAIIQASTIVGIGTAITNLRLMWFALCALPTEAPHIPGSGSMLDNASTRNLDAEVSRFQVSQPQLSAIGIPRHLSANIISVTRVPAVPTTGAAAMPGNQRL